MVRRRRSVRSSLGQTTCFASRSHALYSTREKAWLRKCLATVQLLINRKCLATWYKWEIYIIFTRKHAHAHINVLSTMRVACSVGSLFAEISPSTAVVNYTAKFLRMRKIRCSAVAGLLQIWRCRLCAVTWIGLTTGPSLSVTVATSLVEIRPGLVWAIECGVDRNLLAYVWRMHL